MKWSSAVSPTALLAAAVAAAAAAAGAVAAQSTKCFQLKGSTTCPDLAQFYVHTSTAFNDVASFDTFMIANTLSNATYAAGFRSDFGCPSWDGRGQRYQASEACFFFVENTQCVENPNPLPAKAKLCKTQCLQSVASNAAIFANTTACPATTALTSANRNQLTGTVTQFCNALSDASGSCTPGLASDVAMCGFAQFDAAQAYCATPAGKADGCCFLVLAKASSMSSAMADSAAASLVDPVNSLPYVASGIALGAMTLFSIFFIVCIKARRWRKSSTTAIQPPESDIAPGPLGRSGTIAKGYDTSNDGSNDAFRTTSRNNNRMSVMQKFRQSIGMRSRRTDPALPIAGNNNNNGKFTANAMKQQSMYSDAGPLRAPPRTMSPMPPMPAYMPQQMQQQQQQMGRASSPELLSEYGGGVVAPAAEDTGVSPRRGLQMRVAEAYDAQLSDELTLVVGDIISIDEEYDDGWGLGRNESTGEIGAFPTSCLESLDRADFDATGASMATRSVISARNRSLYASGRGF
ncbi:hypothetical protein HDU87_008662 [Geranomyces variabilis]|uniref:SH3 domain-containing protein n=1 Tax=Geranomyces variabilis TaxID=109894 RepID=A0AAD5XIY6_9FUNG|nr:hypothetical protein HDU87_008662 [Geranomyces variabilis]